jgi:hypothetical protein
MRVGAGPRRLLSAVLAIAAAATAALAALTGGAAPARPVLTLPAEHTTAPSARRPEAPAPSSPTPSSPTPSTPAPSTPARVTGYGIVPTRLRIAVLGVDAAVLARPTETQWDPFLGARVSSFGLPGPTDVTDTAWWSDGARPGDPGLAVILGHTQIGAPGVFNNLGTLTAGARVLVSDSHETLLFTVTRVVAGIPKQSPAALDRTLIGHQPAERLALITCSGPFDGRESVQNLVVFAALA